MKKAVICIISLVLAATVVIGGIAAHRQKQIRYNTNYINGNTAGNLYNGGTFCESDGTLFFANPDDGNTLYCMNTDGSNLKKLCNDSVMYINADSNYIYFVKNNQTSATDYAIDVLYSYGKNSLCRMNRDGGKVTVLDKDPCLYASLIGNYIYYLHYDTEDATTLYKIGIDGKDRTKLSDSYAFTCSADGQYFYFNSTADGSLCRFDTATDTYTKVYDCNCYKPIVTNDGNAYYMDVDQNNALVHTNIGIGTPTVLSSDSIDLYNVYGSYVYYQNYDENGSSLCMVKNDGSDYKVLANGSYCSINVTSYYIYFTDFKTGQVYYTPTANPGEITAFHPGVLE